MQGWIADDPTKDDDETFEPVNCAICAQVHLVNPKTGKVLGADEDWAALGEIIRAASSSRLASVPLACPLRSASDRNTTLLRNVVKGQKRL